MRFNAQRRQMSLKVVYYGPGLGGKTTNLVHLHKGAPTQQRGDLVQLSTESERTLFFDYFPLELGTISGFSIKLDFFTVPGQSFYHATRRAVLEGADGLVFVADSAPEREDANLVSHRDLVQALEERERSLGELPHVFQWNKRDLPRALSTRVLNAGLNRAQAPAVEAVASQGIGVWETQSLIVRLMLQKLRQGRQPSHQELTRDGG